MRDRLKGALESSIPPLARRGRRNSSDDFLKFSKGTETMVVEFTKFVDERMRDTSRRT